MAAKKQLTFEELLDRTYGQEGPEARNAFETRAKLFAISEMIRTARKEAGMTQEQLAEKIGSKKSYISRIENGNSDLRISTLIRIFEDAFGKTLTIIAE
jgi:HTH-type transcriptional regulator / antitoxin HipB